MLILILILLLSNFICNIKANNNIKTLNICNPEENPWIDIKNSTFINYNDNNDNKIKQIHLLLNITDKFHLDNNINHFFKKYFIHMLHVLFFVCFYSYIP